MGIGGETSMMVVAVVTEDNIIVVGGLVDPLHTIMVDARTGLKKKVTGESGQPPRPYFMTQLLQMRLRKAFYQ